MLRVAYTLACCLAFNEGCHGARTLPFEAERWKQAREEQDWDVRSRMADDLVSRGLVVGKTAAEITKLLGTPESYSQPQPRTLYYLIDRESKGIDPCRIEHLVFHLSEDQHVLDAEHEVTLDKC